MRSTVCVFMLIFAALLLVACGPSLPDPKPMPSADFSGQWYSSWGKMALQQKGNHVHGIYKGFRIGSVSGEVEGNLFKFKWTQVAPKMWGRGYLQLEDNGRSMAGQWGYKKNYFNGGNWTATRD